MSLDLGNLRLALPDYAHYPIGVRTRIRPDPEVNAITGPSAEFNEFGRKQQ